MEIWLFVRGSCEFNPTPRERNRKTRGISTMWEFGRKPSARREGSLAVLIVIVLIVIAVVVRVLIIVIVAVPVVLVGVAGGGRGLSG